MPTAKITNFGGMIPMQDDTLLPDTAAALAENTWLYTGGLDGIRTPKSVFTCVGGTSITKAYRIPLGAPDKSQFWNSTWLEFQNSNTTVVESPVVNDSFKRRYWAPTVSGPMYNSQARIAAGNSGANAPLVLGIPTPAVAPGVSVAGGSGIQVSRAYVYTWMSGMGEEGPPSLPTVVTGFTNGTWNITMTAPTGTDTTNRNLTNVRIYRTVTSSAGVATYFLVTTLSIGTTAYADVITDQVVTANAQLQSQGWVAPPSDLQGMIALPNGIVAGWRQNEIRFCEPYRPHAWPAEYSVNVDAEIIGMGVLGQAVVVCTKTGSWACSGVRPASMSLSKITGSEPCLSAGSIVSSPEGVYYASQNGLVLVRLGGSEIITRELIKTDEWQELFTLTGLRSARLGTAYYSFSTIPQGTFESTAFYPTAFETGLFSGSMNGFIIDPTNPRIAMTLLKAPTATINVWNDIWTGEVLIMRNGVVYMLDLFQPTRDVYKWKSKKFQPGDAKNFAALKIYFTVPVGTPALNPVPNASLVQTLKADQWGLARIYADDRLVWTREIRTSGELMKLPSGFTAAYWQVEVESRINIQNMQLSTSAKELKSA